jgi:hypothetical protein
MRTITPGRNPKIDQPQRGLKSFGVQISRIVRPPSFLFIDELELLNHPPSHWSTQSGPNGWYALSFPPTWAIEESESTAGLTAPDGGGVLTVNSFWIDEPETTAVEKILDLDRLFPRRRRVRQLKPIGAAERCIGFQGEALIGEDTPTSWWRRLFRRKHWRHWRIWCLRRGSVYILALYLQSRKIDHEAMTIAGMVVDSLRFSDHPAFPPEVFTRRVVDLAQTKFPLLACEAVTDLQIRLGNSKVNLSDFYRTYVRAPDQFESIVLPVLATVVQVQGWGKAQIEPALDSVRDRIMPMLYPEDAWLEKFPNVVGQEWVGGLVVLYVVDESQTYWYIRDDLLDTWNIAPDELHKLALGNLNRYFEDQPMDFTLAGENDGPRLLVPSRPDTYNTARLLSENFHGKLRNVMRGDFAVGTPSRDFFVAISLDSLETVESVRKKVEDDFQNMDHPLSDRLLLITYDGVTEYAPWV